MLDNESAVVIFKGVLAGNNEKQDFSLKVMPGITIIELLQTEKVPLSWGVTALVNGVVEDLVYRLKPGDEVHLIPQISGG